MTENEVIVVAGARPNFMKVGPLCRAFLADGRLKVRLVHTGQHYDASMSGVFFKELGLPEPDIHLGAGSATWRSKADQSAKPMICKSVTRHIPPPFAARK